MDKDKMAVMVKDLTISFGMVFSVYLLFSKNLAGNVTVDTMTSDVVTALFFYHVGAMEIWMMIFFVQKLSLLGFVLQVLVVDRLNMILPTLAENNILKLIPTSKLMLVVIALYWVATWFKIKKDLK